MQAPVDVLGWRNFLSSIGIGQSFIARNFVTDFGGIGDSVTDNSAAWLAFRTWGRAQTQPVHLTLPPGQYHSTTNESYLPFSGIKKLYVSAYGAIIPHVIRFTSGAGFSQTVKSSARVKTVNVGDAIAILADPAKALLFSVGDWCSLHALEFQGLGGYPPNAHYNQFVQVARVDPIAGIIEFAPPARYIYSDKYPETNPGGLYDTGGPATLSLMIGNVGAGDTIDAWDTDVHIAGLTIKSPSPTDNQLYSPGRKVTIEDCTFVGCGPVPTTNCQFTAIRCISDKSAEIDKMNETVDFVDCHFSQIVCPSSSGGALTLTNTVVDVACTGTPRNIVIRGTSNIPRLVAGVAGYGNTESIVIEVPAVIGDIVGIFNHSNIVNFLSEPGRLTYKLSSVLPFGVPGALIYQSGQTSNFGRYSSYISDVTSTPDDKPIWINTLDSPLPAMPLEIGPPISLVQHPCINVSVANGVTGSDIAVALARGPKNSPLFSYNYKMGNFSPSVLMLIQGVLVSLKINVIQPYTGAQSTALLRLGGIFNNIPVLKPDGTFGQYGPVVNTRFPGLRTITPIAVLGAQPGDSFSIPGAISFINQIFPQLDANISGDTLAQKPVVEIEILTNQLP